MGGHIIFFLPKLEKMLLVGSMNIHEIFIENLIYIPWTIFHTTHQNKDLTCTIFTHTHIGQKHKNKRICANHIIIIFFYAG